MTHQHPPPDLPGHARVNRLGALGAAITHAWRRAGRREVVRGGDQRTGPVLLRRGR